ncbi:DUF6496 domain-containing protein [Asticcacaulis sp. AC402]|uniref:DUF6496 domain-containing protein n=1 Tax=Asticcacaulis sp. AC402 TaxID=1282361 RepID=UPI0003C405E7|nr:DUF6496 domain-containing protein [Asticcacaulis sp. AC402]ESQ76183.1 hypothetical protein ABAC402_06950 [Asticcacaulis sp. AC402]
MQKQTKGQKEKVEKVLREFKAGDLKSSGGKVKSRKQAVAIAMSEAGIPRKAPKEGPHDERRNLTDFLQVLRP